MRGFATFLAAMVIAAGIFWFFSNQGGGGSQRPLARTLSAIGEQFLAVARDSEARDKLKQAFDQFLTRAEAEELPPDQIESVAVVMLNAAAADTVVEPEKMVELMEIVPAPPAPAEPQSEKNVAATPSPASGEREEQMHDVHQRLAKMMTFHQRLDRLRRRHPELADEIRRSVAYRMDRHMKVVMNPDFLENLKEKQRREVERASRDLERQQLLVWAKGSDEQLQEEMVSLQASLDSLRHELRRTLTEVSEEVAAAVSEGEKERTLRLRMLREEIRARQDSLRRVFIERAREHRRETHRAPPNLE